MELDDLKRFDETWPLRIVQLDGRRMRGGYSLSEEKWAIVCDVADELSQVPALFGSAYPVDAKTDALDEAKRIHIYFVKRLEAAGLA